PAAASEPHAVVWNWRVPVSIADQITRTNWPIPQPAPIPHLQNGDRLTRFEFERRANAMPRGSNAELIEGNVFLASPVRIADHGQLHADLMGWISYYRSKTAGLSCG